MADGRSLRRLSTCSARAVVADEREEDSSVDMDIYVEQAVSDYADTEHRTQQAVDDYIEVVTRDGGCRWET